MKKSLHYYSRKLHRYFGVIIGVQFFFWTLGGLFFAWSNLDQIHSDPYKSEPKYFDRDIKLASPQRAIDKLSESIHNFQIKDLKLIHINNTPTYRLSITSPTSDEDRYFLIDATTGEIRNKLSRQESVAMAKSAVSIEPVISKVNEITKKNLTSHHEYRGKVTPAYSISFDHSSGLTVYVSPEMAEVITYRNANWRVFDFLWMMHTMDYSGRDNFGNYLIRFMAILGLITIVSGFIVYYFSSKSFFDK